MIGCKKSLRSFCQFCAVFWFGIFKLKPQWVEIFSGIFTWYTANFLTIKTMGTGNCGVPVAGSLQGVFMVKTFAVYIFYKQISIPQGTSGLRTKAQNYQLSDHTFVCLYQGCTNFIQLSSMWRNHYVYSWLSKNAASEMISQHYCDKLCK